MYPIADGSAGYTEYSIAEDCPELLEYMFDNGYYAPEVLYGHFHSHHNMQAYFSGTDDAELAKNTQDYKIYFSAIINNKRDLVFKATRTIEVEAKIPDVDTVYETYEELPRLSVVYSNVQKVGSSKDLSERILSAAQKTVKKIESTFAAFQESYNKVHPEHGSSWIRNVGKPTTQPNKQVTLFEDPSDGLIWNSKDYTLTEDFFNKDSVYYKDHVIDYVVNTLEFIVDVDEEVAGGDYQKIIQMVGKMTQEQSSDFITTIADNYGTEILEVRNGFESLMRDVSACLRKAAIVSNDMIANSKLKGISNIICTLKQEEE